MTKAEVKTMRKRMRALHDIKERLLRAYQAGVISLEQDQFDRLGRAVKWACYVTDPLAQARESTPYIR